MGSKSDWVTMHLTAQLLRKLAIPYEAQIVSAHRTPKWMAKYATSAAERGIEVIIAAAGGAAHLPGMVAAHTTLPVLGVPIQSNALKGIDSLLSIAQMPAGVPVGTLAIGNSGASNAALLAASILSNKYPELRARLEAFRRQQTNSVRRPQIHVDPGKPVLPASAIGVLGSGQLGRMFAIAARRMGYRVHTLSPDEDTPTGQVADVEINAPYEDLDAISKFASGVSVVTFEFENVPTETVEAAARYAPVRPSGHVLHITQHRLREKTFLSRAGLPVTPFRHVSSLPELAQAAAELSLPAILKTADFGYDGKGQFRIKSPAEFAAAWRAVGEREAVLEAFIDFEREISVVAARTIDGNFVHYGAIENHHRNGILDISIAPARVKKAVVNDAVELSRTILEKLKVIGVLCVEFFVCKDGRLLVNELAPRPHNSGHFTFDANLTSQFEQQLRAVCLLPLGAVTQFRPAAMANLLGDLWNEREPAWAKAAAIPDVKLHLYGKLEPRPGRKMGHLTALAPSAKQALAEVRRAREMLACKL